MGERYICSGTEYDSDEHRTMCDATRKYVKAAFNRRAIHSQDFIDFAKALGHPWNGISTFYIDFPNNEKLNNLLRMIAGSDQPLTIIKIYRLQNDQS